MKPATTLIVVFGLLLAGAEKLYWLRVFDSLERQRQMTLVLYQHNQYQHEVIRAGSPTLNPQPSTLNAP